MNKNLNSAIKFTFLTFLIITAQSGIALGPACYTECVIACGTMGPFKFAAFVGIVLDVMGCSAMCMPFCAGVTFVPGLCFSQDTTFANGTIKMGQVQKQQNLHGNIIEEIIKFKGQFTFIQIQLKNKDQLKILTVTPQHWVYSNNEWKQASSLRLKQLMLSESGKQLEIVALRYQNKQNKYWIQGSSQEIYASGVLTGTSCDRERYPLFKKE